MNIVRCKRRYSVCSNVTIVTYTSYAVVSRPFLYSLSNSVCLSIPRTARISVCLYTLAIVPYLTIRALLPLHRVGLITALYATYHLQSFFLTYAVPLGFRTPTIRYVNQILALAHIPPCKPLIFGCSFMHTYY